MKMVQASLVALVMPVLLASGACVPVLAQTDIAPPPVTNVSAQVELAQAAYARKDYAQAIKLYRLAAEQGDAFAQFSLGFMYS